MKLTFIDWLFVIWYLVLAMGIGFYYSKRAGKSISESIGISKFATFVEKIKR